MAGQCRQLVIINNTVQRLGPSSFLCLCFSLFLPSFPSVFVSPLLYCSPFVSSFHSDVPLLFGHVQYSSFCTVAVLLIREKNYCGNICATRRRSLALSLSLLRRRTE
jgi:hypothetical protein